MGSVQRRLDGRHEGFSSENGLEEDGHLSL